MKERYGDPRRSFHEAGHAAIGVALGLAVESATIERVGHFAGNVPIAGATCYGERAARVELESRIKTAMAGPLAEARACHLSTERAWLDGGAGDEDGIEKLFERACREGWVLEENYVAEWRRYDAETRVLVASYWNAIELVAKALRTARTLSGASIRELTGIDAAPPAFGQFDFAVIEMGEVLHASPTKRKGRRRR